MRAAGGLLLGVLGLVASAATAEPTPVAYEKIGSLDGIEDAANRLGNWNRMILVDNQWDFDRYRAVIPDLPTIDPAKQMLIVMVSWESRKRTVDNIVARGDMLTVQIKEEFHLRKDRRERPPKFVVVQVRAWSGPIRFEINGEPQFTIYKGERLVAESRRLWKETQRLLAGGEPTLEQKIRFHRTTIPTASREQLLARVKKEIPFEITQQRLVTFPQLGEMRATPIVDELFALLEGEENRVREEFRTFRPAWEALVAIGGEEVVAGCRKLQKSKNEYARHAAILILRDFGLESTRELAHVSLRDSYPAICRCGMDFLLRLGLTAEDVPALMAALQHKEPDIVETAAYLLGKLGPTAAAAEPALKKLRGHRASGVRRAAEQALSKIRSAD